MQIINANLQFREKLDVRSATQYIVLHHAAASVSSPEDIHRWHLDRGWAGAGYHYLVRKDGTVYSLRPENTVGAHCKGYNTVSVGVCCEGNFEVEQMGEKQRLALIDLVCYLKEKYPSASIVEHKELAATACAGRNFPLAVVKTMVNDILTARRVGPQSGIVVRVRDADTTSSSANSSAKVAVHKELPGYGSFSGVDMIVSILLPGAQPVTVGECSTVSYSILRDLQEVRTLGRISVRGYARGQRRVAGTIIFTVLEQHQLNNLRAQVEYLNKIGRLKTDELPPFDIIITMASEYGRAARLVIYGATVYEEGKVMSIDDIITENVWSYMARDIILLEYNDYMSEPMFPVTNSTTFLNPTQLLKFSISELKDKYSR